MGVQQSRLGWAQEWEAGGVKSVAGRRFQRHFPDWTSTSMITPHNVAGVLERVAVEKDELGALANLDRADVVVDAEDARRQGSAPRAPSRG